MVELGTSMQVFAGLIPAQSDWVNVAFVELVAQRRHWTRNQRVWGSIPTALVMSKILGQALNLHRLCPPSNNGYQVERQLVLCKWFQLQKILLYSPQGDEAEKE